MKAVLSALVVLAFAAPVAAETYSQKVDCFPGKDGCADDYGEFPPSSDYVMARVAPGLGLGVVCIIICFFGCFLWCCCRCWAKLDCCGVCRMGLCRCCCGAGTPLTTRYSCCERFSMGGALILALILCVMSAGMGISGGKKTYDGATDLLSQSILAVEEMQSLNTNVAKKGFKALAHFYGSSVDYDDTAVNEAIVVVKDHINDFKKKLTDSRDIFDNSCWGFYGLFIVTITLGLCAWACGCGVLSMIMGLIGFLLFFLTWFLFIVFYTTGVIMDDTCVALSEYYYLDCMAEPGKTCQQDKLTDLFQCTDISTVADYYTLSWNLIDSAKTNGAGANQYGTLGKMPNFGYGSASTSGGVATAPAGIGGTAASHLGFEPYTTCQTTYTYSNANGNRWATCASGATNAGIVGPQNSKLTQNVSGTISDCSAAGSCANPGWNELTCAHACLNNSAGGSKSCTKSTCSAWTSDTMGGEVCSGTYTAGSGCVLDSLTNLGGNCMFRKFAHETLTSTYTAGTQGYASCGNKIAWRQNNYVNQPELYQNYSTWMTTYSEQCIDASFCAYETDSAGFKVIPWDGTLSGSNSAACLQAAALAATDIMYALSYIGSCEYVKSFSFFTAVQSGGACFDLGDGLLYLIAAQGMVGFAYFIVVFVGIWGYRCFNSDRAEGAAQCVMHCCGTLPEDPEDPEHKHEPHARVPMQPTGNTVSEVQNPVKTTDVAAKVQQPQPQEQL